MTEPHVRDDLVWVEMAGLRVARIFHNQKEALQAESPPAPPPRKIGQMKRNEAVCDIRTQVFARAKWRCERCGKPLTYKTGHMDERVAKSEGGEVSLDNCWLLCYDCHIGRPDSEHGNRSPQFGNKQ